MIPGTRRAPRRGAVTVWLLACLAIILAIVAIGMDGGRMTDERQRAQAAADAAALAAAADLYANYNQNKGSDPSGTAAKAAKQSAATNGYSDDGTTSVVTVHIPPQSGPFSGQKDYVEVIIKAILDPGFSGAVQSGPLTVQGRAVARGCPRKIGLTVLDPSSAGALSTTGLVGVQVTGAPVVVNSNSATAWTNTSLGIILASDYEITGGYSNTGAIFLGTIHTNVPPSPDPLRNIPAPNEAAYTVRSASQLSVGLGLPVILQPGVYKGGIRIGLGGSVILRPGMYILDGGGLTVANGGVLAGLGVMIYNTGGAAAGPIDVNAVGAVALTPPTSGTYQGISIFQDRTLSTALTLGGVNLQVSGTVYAASAAVNVSGVGVGLPVAPAGAFVCWQLSLSGSLSLQMNLKGNWPRVPDVRLVD